MNRISSADTEIYQPSVSSALPIQFLIILFCFSCATVRAGNLEETIVPNSFLSATRLPQSLNNTPAGMTIITAQDIQNLGISKVPELMRLVPGMRMTQLYGWDYSISFHGTNAYNPKRMAIMINGVAVYHAVFQQIDWTALAIDIKDIERVEVTRSPAGASYGSNAFLCVINIVTRHPLDVPAITTNIETGMGGESYFAQISGHKDNLSYLLSVSEQHDNGFDTVNLNTTAFVKNHNEQTAQRFNFRTEWNIDQTSRINVYANGSMVDSESAELDPHQTDYGYTRQNDSSLNIIYNKTINDKLGLELKINSAQTNFNQHWPTCYPTAYLMPSLRALYNINPSLATQIFAGQTPTQATSQEALLIAAVLQEGASLGADINKNLCGLGNNDVNEKRHNIEVNNTYVLSDSFQLNTGLGYQFNDAVSETHFNGSATSNYSFLFSNGEYSPSKYLTLNAGFMWENASNINSDEISPRLGLNFHLSDNHTLRLVYTTGSRMPGLLETDRKWSYFMRSWDRTVFNQSEGWFFATITSPDHVKPERITSREIGLQGTLPTVAASYDIRVFKELMTNLISEKAAYFGQPQTNYGRAELTGFESELKYKISHSLIISGGYSYLDSEVNNINEETLYSQSAGFINLVYKTNPITYGLSYYGNSKLAGESYNRTDLTLSGKLTTAKLGILDWRISGSYFGFDEIAYPRDINDRVLSRYNENYLLKASIGFAL